MPAEPSDNPSLTNPPPLPSFFLVPSPRFHSDYSGITLLIGDRFLPSRVHQLKLGDMLKLGSSVLLVEKVSWDLDSDSDNNNDNKNSSKPAGSGGNGEEKIPEKLSQDLLKACGGGGGRSETASLREPSARASRYMSDNNNNSDSNNNGNNNNNEGNDQQTELNDDPNTKTLQFLDDNDNDNDNEDPPEGSCCYVCTDDEDSPENRLVNPCACKGGTKYVHISCLRQWATKDKVQGICR